MPTGSNPVAFSLKSKRYSRNTSSNVYSSPHRLLSNSTLLEIETHRGACFLIYVYPDFSPSYSIQQPLFAIKSLQAVCPQLVYTLVFAYCNMSVSPLFVIKTLGAGCTLIVVYCTLFICLLCELLRRYWQEEG